MFNKFPFYRQLDEMDCGPTCLKMIAEFYGKNYTLEYLRGKSHFSRTGVSAEGIVSAAENIGFRTLAIKLPFESDDEEETTFEVVPLPAIVHWNQRHFVVVYDLNDKYVMVADPAKGRFKIPHKAFKKSWLSDDNMGVAIVMETSPAFYEHDAPKQTKKGFGFLWRYLTPYRSLIVQLIAGLALGSIFQLIFPFLTQAIVDIGIQNQNLGFIWLVLLAQLMIFVGQTAVKVLQSWILLHISTRINVSLISDFLIKLMRLPIAFFDSKMIGDLLQRIGDHTRIEAFLTGSTLTFIFSIINFFVFGAVLLYYHPPIFMVFLIASFLYYIWIFIFLKKREEVDYLKFNELSQNQSSLIELIQGMQEIKLQNSENKRRRHWTNIQARLFHANIKSLSITQYQDTGASAINQLKDIIITFIAATAVVNGQITLGMMLAIQYIVGQLNGPLAQTVNFIRTAQDAKISLERLGEIHNKEEEKIDDSQVDILPENADIQIENISFSYNQLEEDVLKNVSLIIPHGKTTAIVGTSGSGKTTLVKLLLGFYQPQQGNIKLGGTHLNNIHKKLWRHKCGAVMQDGFIFSDSIANNVAESENKVDKVRLLQAVKTANIQSFVEDLPLGYNTIIGPRGNGISQGQRQRLLIARAVYKNPDFLFFDEATNALDAKNERVIVENLDQFLQGKTVIVVAHRLSTVRNADQIVVLEKGELMEIGSHEELVALKGRYYKLVKDQLELGS
ncbi:MAG: peptidase domain-containing ABC transporter [Saprospiraceae bacterium]